MRESLLGAVVGAEISHPNLNGVNRSPGTFCGRHAKVQGSLIGEKTTKRIKSSSQTLATNDMSCIESDKL